ncbi:MAG: PQQ-binding-like beta-propeller repeat protein [Gemmatimonadales bacterium]
MRAVSYGLMVCSLFVAPRSLHSQAWGPQSWGETVRRAKNIAPEQPPSTWEAQIDGALAADLIEFVSPTRVLVGLVRTTRLGEPRYADIALVNATDGSIIWQTERDQIGQGNYSLLGSTPLFLLLGANDFGANLSALDSATGKSVWHYRAAAPFRIVRPTPDRILVFAKQGGGRRLEALDAMTGRSLWHQDFDKKAIPDSADASLFVSGDTAVVVAAQITEIDAKSGATLRTIARAAPSDESSAQLAGNVVLVWSGQTVELVDRTAGRSRWTEADPLRAQFVTLAPGSVMRVGKDGDRGVVDRLRPESGTRVWRYQASGAVVSPVAVVNGLVLFSTDSALVALDTATGAPRFVTALSEAVQAAGPSLARRIGIPDQIELRPGPDRLFLSRERAGITAFELPTGKQLWFQPIYERPQPAFDYTAQGRYEWLLQNLALVGRPSAELPPSLSRSSSADVHLHTMDVAQSFYDESKARYDYLRTSPYATRGERQDAADRMVLASEGRFAATQTEVAAGRAMASMQFGASVLNFAIQLAARQNARILSGVIERVQIMMQGATRAEQRAFQGDYYLRPFYKRGRGVTVVSLETGKRRDIIFSPHSEPLVSFGVDMPVFTMGPGGRLVVFGLSLHTDRYVERSLGKSKVPVLSLMSYDVPAMAMIDRQRDWGWLTDFVKAGDIPSLTRTLASGEVDVNSRHWAGGESSLIWAVALGKLDIARFLIAHGADVNQVSDLGQTALDVAATVEMRTYLRSVGGKPAAEVQ